MNRHVLTVLLSFIVFAGVHAADVPEQAEPLSIPEIPQPRLYKGEPEQKVMVKHEGNIKVARANQARLVFIGDSITEAWRSHLEVWQSAFGEYAPANFGIGWDRTQHVLWRLQNGEMEGFTPQVAVVLIGTNNIQPDAPADVAKGITRIVQCILEKSPGTKVLLLGIFPRGKNAEKNVERERITQVNRLIAHLNDDKHIFYRDIGATFLKPDGSLSDDMGPDNLHLTAQGYEHFAAAIVPTIATLMKPGLSP